MAHKTLCKIQDAKTSIFDILHDWTFILCTYFQSVGYDRLSDVLHQAADLSPSSTAQLNSTRLSQGQGQGQGLICCDHFGLPYPIMRLDFQRSGCTLNCEHCKYNQDSSSTSQDIRPDNSVVYNSHGSSRNPGSTAGLSSTQLNSTVRQWSRGIKDQFQEPTNCDNRPPSGWLRGAKPLGPFLGPLTSFPSV